jgi:hypothetical protein
MHPVPELNSQHLHQIRQGCNMKLSKTQKEVVKKMQDGAIFIWNLHDDKHYLGDEYAQTH